MIQVEPSELRRAVESQHKCRAGLLETAIVKMAIDGNTVWEGMVHVFDLAGHPDANRAYAWSSPIEGSNKWRLFSMLHLPPVTSPAEAVRAAIVAESKTM
jgi:hypothetical protein